MDAFEFESLLLRRVPAVAAGKAACGLPGKEGSASGAAAADGTPVYSPVYALETVHTERYFGGSMRCQVTYITDVVQTRQQLPAASLACDAAAAEIASLDTLLLQPHVQRHIKNSMARTGMPMVGVLKSALLFLNRDRIILRLLQLVGAADAPADLQASVRPPLEVVRQLAGAYGVQPAKLQHMAAELCTAYGREYLHGLLGQAHDIQSVLDHCKPLHLVAGGGTAETMYPLKGYFTFAKRWALVRKRSSRRRRALTGLTC